MNDLQQSEAIKVVGEPLYEYAQPLRDMALIFDQEMCESTVAIPRFTP